MPEVRRGRQRLPRLDPCSTRGRAGYERAMSAPRVVGVLGAGTMGAGIAQLAAAAGARTLVHDPDADALERGLAGIAERLEREVEKGRLEAGAAGPLEAAAELGALADADVVIEAAPESLELKRELFGRRRRGRARGLRARHQHLVAERHRDRRGRARARARGRHALLQPRAGDEARRGRRGRALGRGGARDDARARPRDGPARDRRRPTAPASSSTAATARSASRRCGSCRSGSRPTSRSTASAASAAASGWARSSSWTSSGSTSASRSRSRSTRSPSASRAGARRRWRRARWPRATSAARPGAAGTSTPSDEPHRPEDPPAPEPGGGDGRLVVIAGCSPLAEALADAAGRRAGGSPIPRRPRARRCRR